MPTLLTNRRILLGVTGGIAAYKSAELIRRVQDLGADVRVIMTRAAKEFITPLTLQALSGNPVHTDLLDTNAEAAMGHIELARWADVIFIAPASADCLARLARGDGNDLLTTVCLASRCAIAVAPAMNQAMWHNPVTQANLLALKRRNFYQFGPDSGGQACGDVGFGRMSDPKDLAEAVVSIFQTRLLEGRRVVITAGPTREAIDPVRYISNHSSGKMGYALAQAAVDAGASVLLISGPTSLAAPERVECEHVVCAQEMYAASMASVTGCDIFIAAAAVADFRPTEVATQKIKKTGAQTTVITLEKNPDIVAAVASVDKPPFVVGFAAETQNLIDHARKKLVKKNLDLIIANDVSDTGIGFHSDNNAVVLITAGEQRVFAETGKPQLAREIIQAIGVQVYGKSTEMSDANAS